MSWQRPNIGSRMNREVHVRFWERAEVKFLRATRQLPVGSSAANSVGGGSRPLRGVTSTYSVTYRAVSEWPCRFAEKTTRAFDPSGACNLPIILFGAAGSSA